MSSPKNYKGNQILITGVCSKGPYRYAENILINSSVDWINWGYSIEYIHPNIIEHIKAGIIQKGTETNFAIWHIGVDIKAKLLRKGIIDHLVLKKEYLNITFFLKELLQGTIKLPSKDYYLFKYIDI
ncbi:MAG: hypothetical protein ACTSPW_20695 [Promethearchaeota archaeon]